MQSRVLRSTLVATVLICAVSNSADAQVTREPEGTPLPDYAKVLQPHGDRTAGDRVLRSDNCLPNIMLTGYWPPTNEMLRQFSTNPGQNPDGWIGEDWEGRGYNVYAYFPEFVGGLGQGYGDFEVDYQDTSNDWWLIVDQLDPAANITFSRAGMDRDWELEGGNHMFPLDDWADDYLYPFKPGPPLPIADETPGTDRWSTLPMEAIVDAVSAAVPNLDPYYTVIDDSNFLSNYIGYHGTWYHDLHADPADPAWNVAAGHVHVGSAMDLEDAILATEVTVRTLIDYLDSQLPVPGDLNDDREVDLVDYGVFETCFTGPDGGPIGPECEPGDFDCDTDIDCLDWYEFVEAWTAGGHPPNLAECPAVSPALCVQPHDAREHRYISIDPNNTDSVAFTVELTSMKRCSGDLARACIADHDCEAAVPGSGTCIEHPDVGTAGPWWVQAPQQEQLGCLPGPCGDEDWFARLDSTPHFDVWTMATLHVGDCHVIPVVTFHVRACLPPDGIICTDPLTIGTIAQPFVSPGFRGNYGDVAGGVEGTAFTPPDGYTNVVDISAYTLTKQNYGTANTPQTHPTWVDLHGLGAGNPPQYILGVSDLQQILKAFAGDAWTDDPGNMNPGECP